jgi:hypothetical protein
VWQTDRAHGGVALDPAATAVGIPLPTSQLHNPTWWYLRRGAIRETLEEVKMMPSRAMRVKALPDHYTPPDGGPPAKRSWAGRFVWFAVDDQHFVRRP